MNPPLLYNQQIAAQIPTMGAYLKQIISEEIKLPVSRNFFQFRGSHYPIKVVCFKGANIGFFNPSQGCIGVHQKYFFPSSPDELYFVKNILRHEFMHYLLHLIDPNLPHHGSEFRALCRQFNYGQEVYAAKSAAPEFNTMNDPFSATEKLKEKIQKLLSLSTSSNLHEAKLALDKANELMLKHHLDHHFHQSNDEIFWVRTLVLTPRIKVHYHAIASILELFHVIPLFHYYQGAKALEVTGSPTATEIAQYVFDYLDFKMPQLFQTAKRESLTHSPKAFYLGLSDGFIASRRQPQYQQTNALIQRKLHQQFSLVYGNSGQMRSQSSAVSLNDYTKGKDYAKHLHINPGISTNGKDPLQLT